jgi:hypothetical protein
LTRQSTSFVDRVDDVRAVGELIAEEPLVTLTGAGGNGKSRLALRIAEDLLPDFPDGVWLAELAPLAREVLGVPGEVVWPFQTLELPRISSDDHAQDVLAASRMRALALDDIRDRLDDRFRILVGNSRGVRRCLRPCSGATTCSTSPNGPRSPRSRSSLAAGRSSYRTHDPSRLGQSSSI